MRQKLHHLRHTFFLHEEDFFESTIVVATGLAIASCIILLMSVLGD